MIMHELTRSWERTLSLTKIHMVHAMWKYTEAHDIEAPITWGVMEDGRPLQCGHAKGRTLDIYLWQS